MSTTNMSRLTVIYKILCPQYHCLIVAVMHMAGTGFGHNGISFKDYRSHSAFSPTLSKAMNSYFIVEQAIHVCLEDFQDTAAPSRVNTYPLVEFDSSEFAIQLASMYPSSTARYCPFSRHIPWYAIHNLILVVKQSNDHH